MERASVALNEESIPYFIILGLFDEMGYLGIKKLLRQMSMKLKC